MARLAPSLPEIPSSDTVRRRLHQLVLERQQRLLQKLPTGSELSIALDCWTSPFRQAFMAVTGYFIDQDWNYREILLGFEPLHGTHTGINLGTVLFQLLQKHQIEGRVLTVTTDNASNNSTLVESIKDSLQALELPNQTPIIRIPCIAHVIQLSLKELLGQMDVNPKNDREEMEFTGEKSGSRRENQEIIITLNKVRRHLLSGSYYISTNNPLDSKACRPYQQKPAAPRSFPRASVKRAKTCTYPRCANSLELDIFNASACETASVYL